MRKVIHKWFWAWQFEQEEIWLNQMVAQGLALVGIGFGRYTFEPCTPGEYCYRLELLEHFPGHVESQLYINFVVETGAEYLGSINRWVYFRKPTAQGAFDLYSDNASRIQHLNRLLPLVSIVSIMNLSIGLSNLTIFMSTGSGENLGISIINLSLGLFIGYGWLQIYQTKKKLRKEQSLFE